LPSQIAYVAFCIGYGGFHIKLFYPSFTSRNTRGYELVFHFGFPFCKFLLCIGAIFTHLENPFAFLFQKSDGFFVPFRFGFKMSALVFPDTHDGRIDEVADFLLRDDCLELLYEVFCYFVHRETFAIHRATFGEAMIVRICPACPV